jgi:hypothetical protein
MHSKLAWQPELSILANLMNYTIFGIILTNVVLLVHSYKRDYLGNCLNMLLLFLAKGLLGIHYLEKEADKKEPVTLKVISQSFFLLFNTILACHLIKSKKKQFLLIFYSISWLYGSMFYLNKEMFLNAPKEVIIPNFFAVCIGILNSMAFIYIHVNTIDLKINAEVQLG